MDFQPPDYKTHTQRDWLSLHLKKINPKFVLVIPLLIIPFFLYRTLSIAAMLVLLTVLVSYIVHKTHLKKFGIELVTFTTVITGVVFGAVAGAVLGVVLIVIHNLITHRINAYWFVVIPSFCIMGALAGVYSKFNLVLLGLGLTIMSHLVFIISQTIVDAFPERYMLYFAINIFFNVSLFYALAPKILAML